MSITQLSRFGFVLITLLLLAVVGFAYTQNRKTNELMESNVSVVAPTRDALGKINSQIADSAFQLVQFLRRDTIRSEDVLDLLQKLADSESSLIAASKRNQAGTFLRPRYAQKALIAFKSFLDEEENDSASDTTIALK